MTYRLLEVLGKPCAEDALVTVISPVKNCENEIEGLLNQVRSQLDVKKHHIIIDGGSTDRTIEILRKNITIEMQIIIGEDKSNIDATNFALDYVKTEYFQILTVGDEYNCLNFLKKNIDFAEKTKSSVVWGDTLYDGHYLYGAKHERELKIGKTSIDFRTIIAKTSTLKKIGKFNEKYKYACDFEWLNIAIKNNYRMRYCNEGVAIVTSANGISANNYLAARKEVENIVKEYWGYSLSALLYSIRVYIGYWLKKMYAVIR